MVPCVYGYRFTVSLHATPGVLVSQIDILIKLTKKAACLAQLMG